MNSEDAIPFIDLKAQFAPMREEILSAVTKVFDEQKFILGETVEAFEDALGQYIGLDSSSVVGVSSGTDALLSALMAAGVSPGDRVLTTPFSFFATAGVIARLHAIPEFVDIDLESFNLDVDQLRLKNPHDYKAIIVVHLYGRCADIGAVKTWAGADGPMIIEDSAQAIGCKDPQGNFCGTLGDVGCFSFFPTKNLGAAGDGGCQVAVDSELSNRLRTLRTHGAVRPYESEIIGGNFRLHAVQAAVLHSKLKYLHGWTTSRLKNARRYNELLGAEGLDEHLILPTVPDDGSFIAHQYVVRTQRRDALRAHLKTCGVASAIYYPVPFHLMECFRHLGHRPGAFESAERAANEVLALPIFAELGPSDLERVVAVISEFFQG